MYKRELQEINTQNKAYLLGLFYSDGNVSLKQSHCRIALHKNDLSLLKSIKSKFEFFKLYADENKNQFILYSGYKAIKEDLINNGCFPQKSTFNKDKLILPTIKEELLRHFIRGYFDGDGGCHLNVNSKKIQKRIYIYSASKLILDQISNILFENSINSVVKNSRENLYILSISTVSYENFYNYLYKDAILKMKRKVLKFNNILKTNFFTQRIAPICVFCNSYNTVFDGFYSYKENKSPRILCKECTKRHILRTAPISSNTNSGGDELLES